MTHSIAAVPAERRSTITAFVTTAAPTQPVLVIGASGLVGWHAASAFPEGNTVRVAFANVGAGMRRLDIRDADSVVALVGEVAPSVIVHAAADPNVEACERDPAGTRHVNVDGVRNVAKAAAAARSKLVYFSSDYVFDGAASAPYGEDDPTAPANEYGRQKVDAESIVLSNSSGLVCRISGVFGWERGRTDCRNFVCQVIRRLESGERVRAASDQTLCPTYAPDIAVVVSQLIRRNAAGVVHVAGPDPMTRAEFACAVAESFRLSADRVDAVPTSELKLVATRPRYSALSTSRLAALGIDTPRPVRAALKTMAEERP